MTRLDDIRARTDGDAEDHFPQGDRVGDLYCPTCVEDWPCEASDIPYLLGLVARLDAATAPSEAAGTDGYIPCAEVQRIIHEGDPE